LFENRGNDEFLPRRGSFQGKNRKAIFRLARIFDAERGPFWVKRRPFRFFKQALTSGLVLTEICNMPCVLTNSSYPLYFFLHPNIFK
jgi:hypothetical protein